MPSIASLGQVMKKYAVFRSSSPKCRPSGLRSCASTTALVLTDTILAARISAGRFVRYPTPWGVQSRPTAHRVAGGLAAIRRRPGVQAAAQWGFVTWHYRGEGDRDGSEQRYLHAVRQ